MFKALKVKYLVKSTVFRCLFYRSMNIISNSIFIGIRLIFFIAVNERVRERYFTCLGLNFSAYLHHMAVCQLRENSLIWPHGSQEGYIVSLSLAAVFTNLIPKLVFEWIFKLFFGMHCKLFYIFLNRITSARQYRKCSRLSVTKSEFL